MVSHLLPVLVLALAQVLFSFWGQWILVLQTFILMMLQLTMLLALIKTVGLVKVQLYIYVQMLRVTTMLG
jgi:hypothetical protein